METSLKTAAFAPPAHAGLQPVGAIGGRSLLEGVLDEADFSRLSPLAEQ
jgi:hypothetical protein